MSSIRFLAAPLTCDAWLVAANGRAVATDQQQMVEEDAPGALNRALRLRDDEQLLVKFSYHFGM